MARIRQQVVTSTGEVSGADKHSYDVDALADGGWISTWLLAYQDKNDVVYQTRFDAAGRRIGNDVQVDSSLKGHQSDPATLTLADGGWVAMFSHGFDGPPVFERFNKHGRLVEKLDNLLTLPTKLENGDYVATWFRYDPVNDSRDIYQQRYNANFRKIGSETLITEPHKHYDQTRAQITALADGGWINQYHSEVLRSPVWQRFDADGKRTTVATKVEFVEVTAALPDGGWVSAGEVDQVIRMLQFDRHGKQLGNSTLVTDVPTEQSYSPTITILPSGGWLITSTDRMHLDGEYGEPYFLTVIRQRQYDADGLPVGGSRQVSDYGSDIVQASSVSVLKDGGWIVTWSQDGEVYQKRYEANGKVWFKNDSPAGFDYTIAVEKDGAHRFSTDEFRLVDKNGDRLKGVVLDKLPTSGKVTLSGHDVKPGDFVAVADISKLVWKPPANKLGKDVATLSFRVVDDGGTAHQGTNTDRTSNVVTFDLLKAVRGTSKGDVLTGGTQSEILLGYAGNDKITGGRGADVLTGGDGGDRFIYKSVSESTATDIGRDTILDFSGRAGDRIDLSMIDANTLKEGNQAFSFIGKSLFHGKAGEVRYEKRASDTYIYADVNGDKKADFSIHLDDAVTLSKGYFIL
ncbi:MULTISPECIES: M10 family metallopeptidase C-terminal domain-containing protein [unclassified Rhizobium]|uniref:M10 family metallopeptidase C-terminal domain-containing protein n=1 Tax=unclassified Rhizobium TaxID=2613769 RepID=UPI000B092710|nr:MULTISPECIES: M10 family metallopeptidase C-terminal domain-containing protein [unclassified Rhizobium]